jgi:asparagine synthase (glutamine-hydrolysing)
MCGISGIVGGGSLEVVKVMTDVIAHRGPDHHGSKWFAEGKVGLGHRRLSIIDLSPLGHQPMTYRGHDRWIIFNGEIYNFNEVRKELEGRGHVFRSHSDTEVILAGYEEWGDDVCQHLNGMFAFAIWDAPRQRLFAARDRLGVKPFYYTVSNGAFVFSSEIKALLKSGMVNRAIDSESLEFYLTLQYVPGPKTLFRDVLKLMPGTTLAYESGRITLRPYWHAPFRETAEDVGERRFVDEFRQLFNDAVKIRMISDVPIGAFLSGGIDSSIVVCEMARLSREPIRTYSVGFVEGGKHYDELPFAEIVSRHYGTEHRVVVCDADEAAREIPDLIYYLDEPVSETLIYPYNKISRLAKHTASVVLTGEGADEFLHGYRYYSVLNQYRRTFDRLPGRIRAAIGAVLSRTDIVENTKVRILAALLRNSEPERVVQWSTIIPESERRRLTGYYGGASVDSFFENLVPSSLDRACVASFLEHRYRMVDYILMRTDKMSMETALECRSPFLDYRVVEFMTRLPKQYKAQGGVEKAFLRKAFAGDIPAEILNRRKKPFAAPIHSWLGPLTRRYLVGSELVRDGVLDARAVASYLSFDRDGRARHAIKVWLLLMLEVWYRHYITGSERPGRLS